MGKKGDKMTNASVENAKALLEKLKSIKEVTSKKMFGGHGIFHDSKMFGMISSKGECFFKVNESNVKDYEDLESVKHSRMPYYSIPSEVMNDDKLLKKWAKKSIEISK